MELLEMLTRKMMETKVWSVNIIGIVEGMEKIDDEVYFLNDEKESIMANYGMGSCSNHQEASKSYWRQGYRNQVRNYECAADLGDQEREESINSKIEIMLKRILERVVSTD
ncbi:hypothetical protein HAX54_021769 [Datura stramonium]|uniref:Uncharacterized protein n=1 Tax=Datura stramonium TaxID=4076 RepID=A0ABS8UVN2_DATST|nr:hypothetical protein [Datura stramonium]